MTTSPSSLVDQAGPLQPWHLPMLRAAMVPMAKATINILCKKVGTDIHIIPETLSPETGEYVYLNVDSGTTYSLALMHRLYESAKSTMCFYAAGEVELGYEQPTVRMPRDYELFGILSSCRGQAPVSHPNGICAGDDNRSWPKDASDVAKNYSANNGLHDFGYISLEKLNEVLSSETAMVRISQSEADIKDLLAHGSSWRLLPGVEFHIASASEAKVFDNISMAEAIAILSVTDERVCVVIENKLSYAKFLTNVKKRVNDGNIYPDDWGVVINVETETIPVYQAIANSFAFTSLVKRLNQIAEANGIKPSDIRILVAYDS